MEVVTYTLRGDGPQSEQYYADVAGFTDRVMAEGETRLGPLVRAFRSHLQATGGEALRTPEEYTYEFLALGVLWRVYAGQARGLGWAAGRLLAGLSQLRERAPRLKPGLDPLRGVLAARFLQPAGPRVPLPAAPSLEGLSLLLRWLRATGTFDEPAKRLRAWHRFLAGQPPEQATAGLAAALALAGWFEVQSGEALGRYTPNVERFLAETAGRYRRREDAILCGRQRVEYHLCMVGTEVLNRAMRGAFLATARKVVLLPPCMRAQPEGRCRARATDLGARCTACTPGCRVRDLTALGQSEGVAVLLLPGELAVFSKARRQPAGDAMGIVGVSCVLTNTNGGWQARELGIPAQGVPLDYCGCSWHWHPEGFPTDVNERQLLRAVGMEGPAEEA